MCDVIGVKNDVSDMVSFGNLCIYLSDVILMAIFSLNVILKGGNQALGQLDLIFTMMQASNAYVHISCSHLVIL